MKQFILFVCVVLAAITLILIVFAIPTRPTHKQFYDKNHKFIGNVCATRKELGANA